MKKRVVVTGTFDILHPGHVYLISEAAKLGDVIVVVARDSNVLKTKGHPPVIPQDQRRFMVQAIKGVTQAVLGHEGPDYLRIIVEINPDILLLGPNQDISLKDVQHELQQRGLETEVLQLGTLFTEYQLCSTSAILARTTAIRQRWPLE